MTEPIGFGAGDHAEAAARIRDKLRDTLGPPTAAPDLPTAARAALPALELLGDYIGNTFAGGHGYPAFDRCQVILDLKRAIEAAEAPPVLECEYCGLAVPVDGSGAWKEALEYRQAGNPLRTVLACIDGDACDLRAEARDAAAEEEEEDPPEPVWDPGPEVDDEGGASEHRHLTTGPDWPGGE